MTATIAATKPEPVDGPLFASAKRLDLPLDEKRVLGLRLLVEAVA
jgi:hypothetical protein